MAVLLTPPKLQFFDNSGNLLAFGKVYTYTSTGGTFATQKATYTTAAGDVENANPVILDSAGRANIWIDGSYDFRVCDSDDVQLYTQLAVTAFTALPAASTAYFQTFSGTGAQTAFTTSTDLGTDEKAIYVWVDAGGGEGYEIQNITAYTISGTTLTFASAPASGTNNIYVSAPSTLVGAASSSAAAAAASEAAAAASASSASSSASTATTQASNASSSASAASTSATNAASSASSASSSASTATTQASAASASASAAAASAASLSGGLSSTSTSSVAIGTGAKTFTTQASKLFVAGQYLIIASGANNANYMHGQVTSYSSTSLVMNITDIGGSGTFADWVISVSGTQGTVPSTVTVSQGGTGVTSLTAYAPIFGGTTPTGTVQSGTVGTAGQVLTSNGPGALPSFQSGGSGALILLNTQTASSSATIDFTSTYITTTYKEYIVEIIDAAPATDNVDLLFRFSQSGTFASGGTDYQYGEQYTNSSFSISTADTTAASSIKIGVAATGNGTNKSLCATIRLFDPTRASGTKKITFSGGQNPSFIANCLPFYGIGEFVKNTTACDGIRFLFNSGNILTGTIKLYGVV